MRPKHIVLIFLGLQSLVTLQSQNLVGNCLELEGTLVEYGASPHGLHPNEGSEP